MAIIVLLEQIQLLCQNMATLQPPQCTAQEERQLRERVQQAFSHSQAVNEIIQFDQRGRLLARNNEGSNMASLNAARAAPAARYHHRQGVQALTQLFELLPAVRDIGSVLAALARGETVNGH